jgi:hypothetical protein
LKALLLLSFALSLPAFSHVKDSDDLRSLPEGTVLSLKEDLNLLPNTTSLWLSASPVDTDGDGVRDKLDYCPKTAAGTTVWTVEGVQKAQQQGQSVASNLVGCTGQEAKDDRLGTPVSEPGDSAYCKLQYDTQPYDRVLKNSRITLEVTKVSVVFEKTFTNPYRAYYTPNVTLEVATAGGFTVQVVCQRWESDIGLDNGKTPDPLQARTPTVAALKAFLNVQLPAPVEVN